MKTAKKKCDRPAPAITPGSARYGDAFLAIDGAGRYWTGSGWSADRSRALRFDGEPDPFSEVMAFIAASDVRCCALYLPRRDVRKSSPARSSGTQSAGGRPTISTAKAG